MSKILVPLIVVSVLLIPFSQVSAQADPCSDSGFRAAAAIVNSVLKSPWSAAYSNGTHVQVNMTRIGYGENAIVQAMQNQGFTKGLSSEIGGDKITSFHRGTAWSDPCPPGSPSGGREPVKAPDPNGSALLFVLLAVCAILGLSLRKKQIPIRA